jgi:hypothetical protein
MITDKGVELLGKYLVGQIPSYASHIAIGCGANPRTGISLSIINKALTSSVATITTSDPHGFYVGDMVSISGVDDTFNGTYEITTVPSSETFTFSKTTANVASTAVSPEGLATLDFSLKTSLDLETARVPITSRTLNVDSGVTEVVFTAELPVDERYAITEVGVYPSEDNSAAGTEVRRILYGFQETDGWLFNDVSAATSLELPIKQTRLDSASTGDIDVTETFFQTYPDNATFLFESRLNRQEQPRYLSNAVIVRGDSSLLDDDSSEPASAQDHLVLSGVDLSFLDRANPAKDEIRLAFSVINKTLGGADPSRVQVMVEFANTDAYNPSTYARLRFNEISDNYDYSDRYIVASSTLANLDQTENFKWSAVSFIKIYVDIDNSSSYYAALDALSFENLSSIDAQYGMSGYTVIKNSASIGSPQSRPVIKYDNELSLLEFKFALDVG